MNERVTPGLCSYYFSARFQKLAKCSVCDLKSRVFPTKKLLLVFLAEKISVRAFLLNICLMCYYVLSNTRNTPPPPPTWPGARGGGIPSV